MRTSTSTKQTVRVAGTVVFLHLALVWLSMLAPTGYGKQYLNLTHTVFDHLMQWDSQWYVAVGRYGYQIPSTAQQAFSQLGNQVPFVPALRATVYFPLVPMLVHVLGAVGAVILTNAVFAVTVGMMFNIFRKSMTAKQAYWGVLCYALNPAFIFQSSLYVEVFMVLFTLLVVYGMSTGTRGGQVLACIAGFAASLTHETGMLVVVFALRFVRTRNYKAAITYVLFVVAGCCSYLAYLWLRFGQPLVIFQAEKTWYRTWRFPGESIIGELSVIPSQPVALIDLICVVLLGTSAVAYLYTTARRNYPFSSLEGMRVNSIETALWVLCQFILCMCTYVSGDPLMSVTRLMSIMWPVYSFTWLSHKSRYPLLWRGTYIVGYSFFGYMGAALFTHGMFFQ